MNEKEVLEKVSSMTDDEFNSAVKAIVGFDFVSSSAKKVLQSIVNEKTPVAIPEPAVIEEELTPVIEQVAEPINEAEIIEEPKVEEPVVVSEPIVPTIEKIEEKPIPPVEAPSLSEIERLEKQIKDLNKLLSLEDEDDIDALEKIKSKIKFYEILVKNKRKKSDTITDTPTEPKSESKPVVPNSEAARKVINMLVGLNTAGSIAEDDEEALAMKRRAQKSYNALTKEEKEFVDSKLDSLKVKVELKEELKKGGKL